MNRYELTLCKINDSQTGERYHNTIYGETIQEAINIANYWSKPNELIGTDFAITGCIETRLPYEPHEIDIRRAIRAMDKAICNKIESVHKILQSNADDEDKEDMIKCIMDEAPYMLYELDTICRDRFIKLMED